jgi:hypothetical protein
MFEGNECKKLLDNIPLLTDILRSRGKEEVGEPFIKIFESFGRIIENVYKAEVNKQSLKTEIEAFGASWKESSMTLTTKAHMVMCHLEDFINFVGDQPVALFSEQTHEAVHAEFNRTWEKYLVKEDENPMFAKNLLQAIFDFNATHAK